MTYVSKTKGHRLFAAVSCLSLAAVMQASPASAQEAAESAQTTGLQDIVVTAQRRSERMQDVPIAVSAITAADAAARGVTDVRALSSSIPNLSIGQNATQANIFLRGVGSQASNPNSETSVGIYIDGVYIAAPVGNLFAFNNIERVEVLKGPQGTLFGRNATGGVIQIITRTPSHTPGVEANIGYANYNTITGGGYATTGLGANAAIDFAIDFRHQGDGWGRNIIRNEDSYINNYVSMRSKLLFEPSDRTTITIAGDYSRHDGSAGLFAPPPGRTTFGGAGFYAGRYNVRGGSEDHQWIRVGGGSLTVEQDVGFARIVSISAYRRTKQNWRVDVDSSPVPGLDGNTDTFSRQYSQELRLESVDSPIEWVLGAYYFNYKAGNHPTFLTGVVLGGIGGTNTYYAFQKTESVATFGQVTVPLTDTTKLTGGLRYTHDSIDYSYYNITPAFGRSATVLGKNEYGKPTWRIALNQKLTEDVSAYVSYNHGVKAGGFELSGGTASIPGFNPEQLDAYEAGIKSELFGRRLRVNIAGFLYDYKDMQIQQFVGANNITTNATSAELYGIDLDITAAPVRNLTLSAGLGLLHSKFKEYTTATFFGIDGGRLACVPNCVATGNELPFAPKVTGSASAQYRIESAMGNFDLNATVIYNDGNFVAPDNVARIASYTRVNTSIGWTSENESYGLTLWAKNLFDEEYFASMQHTEFGILKRDGEPRTYGVTARVKF